MEKIIRIENNDIKILRETSEVILALIKHDTEYVTWSKSSGGGYCWGHYFSKWASNDAEKNAIKDYEERVKRGF